MLTSEQTNPRRARLAEGLPAILTATRGLGPLLLLMLGVSGAWIANRTAPEPYGSILNSAAVLMAASPLATPQRASSRSLVFLTREGCGNTTTMRARLDQALDRLDVPEDYVVVDVDTLPESDTRRGYGTPTVLYDDRDLFGMPAPTPPIPAPT